MLHFQACKKFILPAVTLLTFLTLKELLQKCIFTYIFLEKKVQMLPLLIFSRNQDAVGSKVSSLVQCLN